MSKKRANVKKTKSETQTKQCIECLRELEIKFNFYNTNSISSIDGKCNICKKCLNDKIDYKNINTIYKVLQLLDVPFLYHYWEVALERKPNDPWSSYIRMANSKLNEFKDKTYQDSVFKDGDFTIPRSNERKYSPKWMGSYTEWEIEYLEKYLSGLHNDFKIVTENHKDYAKKIAKASLHMDRCFEDMQNGVSGADRRYKDAKDVFDSLSKSAQFSESQRGQNDVGLGCFGKVFEMVEKKQWIPQHYPMEEDAIDKIINQFNHIFKSV